MENDHSYFIALFLLLSISLLDSKKLVLKNSFINTYDDRFEKYILRYYIRYFVFFCFK